MDSSSFEMITAKSSTPFREKYFSLPSSLLHTGQRPSCPYHLSTQGVQPSSRWQQPETVIGRAILKQIQHLKFSLMLVDSMLLLWHTLARSSYFSDISSSTSKSKGSLSGLYLLFFPLLLSACFFFLLVIREGNGVDFFCWNIPEILALKKGKKLTFKRLIWAFLLF